MDAIRDAEGKLTRVRFSRKKRVMHADWDNMVLEMMEIDGKRLIAEVNQEARAKTISKKIETAPGKTLHCASEIQLEKMLVESRAAGGVRTNVASQEIGRLAERPEVRRSSPDDGRALRALAD